MARKAHLELTGKLSPRERVWAAIRELRSFTYADIERACRDVRADTIMDLYIRSLERGGYLRRLTKRGGFISARFELVRDVGIEAPRVDRDGNPVRHGSRQQALWKALSILKTFTFVELAAAANTDEVPVGVESAKRYVRYLARAGYVVAATGKACQAMTFRFIPARYSGPRAPEIRAKNHVYDPNLGTVTWYPEERS